jgi:hypothetical protein
MLLAGALIENMYEKHKNETIKAKDEIKNRLLKIHSKRNFFQEKSNLRFLNIKFICHLLMGSFT